MIRCRAQHLYEKHRLLISPILIRLAILGHTSCGLLPRPRHRHRANQRGGWPKGVLLNPAPPPDAAPSGSTSELPGPPSSGRRCCRHDSRSADSRRSEWQQPLGRVCRVAPLPVRNDPDQPQPKRRSLLTIERMGKYDEVLRDAQAAARQKRELEAKIRRFQAAAVFRLAEQMAQEGREVAAALRTARRPVQDLVWDVFFPPKGWRLPMRKANSLDDTTMYWDLRKDGIWLDSGGTPMTLSASHYPSLGDDPSALLNDDGTGLRAGVVIDTNFSDLWVVDGKLIFNGPRQYLFRPLFIDYGSDSYSHLHLQPLEDALRHAIGGA